MRSETVMTLYQDIVLECQNCYAICRFDATTARHNCPSCGLHIQNWDELGQQLRKHPPPANSGAV